MPIVADLQPERPATAARRLGPAPAPATEGPLLRWLRDQFLALPHVPGASLPSSPQVPADENLAN